MRFVFLQYFEVTPGWADFHRSDLFEIDLFVLPVLTVGVDYPRPAGSNLSDPRKSTEMAVIDLIAKKRDHRNTGIKTC